MAIRVGDTVDVKGCRVVDVWQTPNGTVFVRLDGPPLPTGEVGRLLVPVAGVVLSREQVVPAPGGTTRMASRLQILDFEEG